MHNKIGSVCITKNKDKISKTERYFHLFSGRIKLKYSHERTLPII